VQIVALVHPRGALIFDDGVVVYFEQGRILHVHSPMGVEVDMAFVADVFARDKGGLRFEPTATLPAKTLNIDPMGVLLEVARVSDETIRDAPDANASSVALETEVMFVDINARDVTVLPSFAVAETYIERLRHTQNFHLQQARDVHEETFCVAIVGELITMLIPETHLDDVPVSLRRLLKSVV